MSLIRVSRSTAANSILTHRFNQHEFSLQRCHKRTLASLLRLFFFLIKNTHWFNFAFCVCARCCCFCRCHHSRILNRDSKPTYKISDQLLVAEAARSIKNGHKRTKEAETKMFDNNLKSLASWRKDPASWNP